MAKAGFWFCIQYLPDAMIDEDYANFSDASLDVPVYRNKSVAGKFLPLCLAYIVEKFNGIFAQHSEPRRFDVVCSAGTDALIINFNLGPNACGAHTTRPHTYDNFGMKNIMGQ